MVLIIDDDKAGRDAVAIVLELAGFKVILTSGYPEREVLGNRDMQQPAGFLQKPYDLHDLVLNVNQVID